MTSVLIDNQDYADELKDLLQCGVKYHCDNGTLFTKDYTFTFAPNFTSLYEHYSQYCNPLIYGKNTMLGIVAVEVVRNEVTTENQLQVFFFDGTSKFYPYKQWILTPQKEDAKSERLEGFLHFKYLKYVNPGENLWRYKDKFQIWNDREAALTLHGLTLFKGLKPSQLGVLSFDIEAVGLSQDDESDVFIITNSYQKNGTIIRKHFRKDEYENTGEMIEKWCEWVREVNPDVMVGHNIYGYDLPYLSYVGNKYGIDLCLGRDGSVISFSTKPSKYRVDGNTDWDYHKAHIFGRQIIDGMFLAVKYDFGRKYPSWGLKAIAEAEGLVKPGRQFYDASKIRDNWDDPVEREKIVQYAIDDSDDSLNLYNLMIPAYFYMCQSLPIPFEEMMQGATGKWVNSIMVRSYLQDKRSIPQPSQLGALKGGISFGVPGIYRNVIKADLKSAYPSQVLRFKLYDKQKDPDAHFYQMVKHFAEKRFHYKKMEKETGESQWMDMNTAAKTFINSAYGALSTNGLNYNSPELARKITYETRQTIIQAVEWASGKGIHHWFPDYVEDENV